MRSITTVFSLLVLLTWLVGLSGCATGGDYDDPTANWTAKQIYQEASTQLKDKNWERSIQLFEKLEGRYPYGRYAEQGRLDIAYAHYKNGEPESAILAADRFIKLYPRHPNVDYAYYLKGLASFGQGRSFLYRWFDQDMSERDPKAARKSFQYFKELVTRFPNSRYAPDAVKRMVFLRERLAKHELHVADYYMRRGAYLAAANRAKHVIENYERTPQVEQALVTLVRAYHKLKLHGLAGDALRVLEKNYPKQPTLAELKRAQARQ